jgi:hypothetical protein
VGLTPSPPSPLPRIEILTNVKSLQAGERGVEFPRVGKVSSV